MGEGTLKEFLYPSKGKLKLFAILLILTILGFMGIPPFGIPIDNDVIPSGAPNFLVLPFVLTLFFIQFYLIGTLISIYLLVSTSTLIYGKLSVKYHRFSQKKMQIWSFLFVIAYVLMNVLVFARSFYVNSFTVNSIILWSIIAVIIGLMIKFSTYQKHLLVLCALVVLFFYLSFLLFPITTFDLYPGQYCFPQADDITGNIITGMSVGIRGPVSQILGATCNNNQVELTLRNIGTRSLQLTPPDSCLQAGGIIGTQYYCCQLSIQKTSGGGLSANFIDEDGIIEVGKTFTLIDQCSSNCSYLVNVWRSPVGPVKASVQCSDQ